MKDYKKVADGVFERSEKIIADNRRKKNKMKKAASAIACFCLIALLGVGVWQNRTRSNVTQSGDGDIVIGGISHTADTESHETTAGKSYFDVVNNEEKPSAASTSDDNNGATMAAGSDFQYHYRTMISSYGDGSAAEVSYAAPENGVFKYSIPLQGALDEYGDSDENGDILYRVFVNIFKDQNKLAVNSDAIQEERDRLFACGYTVAMETYYDGQENHYYFTLHATKKQLINFAANDKYGYMFFLYDECVPE